MDVINMNELTAYLIEILCSALHGNVLGIKPDSVNWELIFSLLQYNGVSGFSYFAIEELDDNVKSEINPELLKKWKEDRDRILYSRIHFDIEREMILNKMEENQISYLLLKGILLQDYYPKAGMRAMSDNDILYGFVEYKDGKAIPVDYEQKEAMDIMINIMTELGYEFHDSCNGIEEFFKKPVLNFELHRYLISTNAEKFNYYENSWKNAIQSESSPFCYYMSDEDEYIFLVNHAVKHYDYSECGFRFLLDIFVFLQKKGDNLNWEYINQELSLLNIKGFEEEMRELSVCAFSSDCKLSESQLEFISRLIDNGTYGTDKSILEARMNRYTKNKKAKSLGYVLKRLYPSKSFYQEQFPKLSKFPILIPFLAIYRIIRGLFVRPKRACNEIKLFFKNLLLKNKKDTNKDKQKS